MTQTTQKCTFAEADKSKIPANAFRLAEKPFLLSAGDAPEGKYPVRLVCRTSAPVESWFWGTCYHDLEGMKLSKERLPIDYIHDDSEVIGFLDKFSVENGELVATGELTPFRDDDRASEIIHKLKAGVPYEASINFSGETNVEEVAKNGSALVNGGEVTGPCLIFRKWTLRGVAVCPYGADGQTSTSAEFAQGETIPVTVLANEAPAEETPAPEEAAAESEASESAPADTPAPADPPPAEDTTPADDSPPAEGTPPAAAETLSVPAAASEEDPRALFRRMCSDFGVEIASKVFADGGSYEDARAAKFAALQKGNEDLRREIARLSEENKQLVAGAAARKASAIGGTPAVFAPAPATKRKLTLLDACTYGTAKCGEHF